MSRSGGVKGLTGSGAMNFGVSLEWDRYVQKMHGGVIAPSFCVFPHRVAFKEVSGCSLSEYVPLWSLSTFGFSFRLPFGFSNFNYIVSQSLITRVWQRGVLNYQRTYSDTQACAFLFVSIWPILLQQISIVHDGSGPVFTSSVDVSQLRACPFIWCPSCIRK